jgi:hypothetical protein
MSPPEPHEGPNGWLTSFIQARAMRDQEKAPDAQA